MKMLASASASPLPANLSMNLRTHILRSNGYRELGMFDESILELEEIDGEDRWQPSSNPCGWACAGINREKLKGIHKFVDGWFSTEPAQVGEEAVGREHGLDEG